MRIGTQMYTGSLGYAQDADVGELPEVPITFQIYLLTYGKTVMISKISLCVLHPILGDLQSVSVIPVLPPLYPIFGEKLNEFNDV